MARTRQTRFDASFSDAEAIRTYGMLRSIAATAIALGVEPQTIRGRFVRIGYTKRWPPARRAVRFRSKKCLRQQGTRDANRRARRCLNEGENRPHPAPRARPDGILYSKCDPCRNVAKVR